jgi:NADPH:quinone reductase-like Zn-dependent oxidoreductase
MKALVLKTADGPASAKIEECDIPMPAAGEVRVALKAASLNHRELFISRGMYPGMRLPAILGADGAGVIEAVGDGVDITRVGEEVVLYPAAGWGDDPRFPSATFGLLGMPHPGTLANYICVAADSALAKPTNLSFNEAACLPVAALTAWRALTVKANVAAGETVLVTGIGGGVAVWALKFAQALGAKVFVTSGSDEKITQAVELGASGGVNYREEKWGKALGAMTGGVDVVIDGAPGGGIGQYVRSLNMGARVVVYGSTGKPDFTVMAPELFLRHASIVGTAMGTVSDFQAMVAFVQEKNLKPVIEKIFNLAEAGEALCYLESNHQLGKVVVEIAK